MSAITPQTELRLIKCPIEEDNRNQINFANVTAQYNYFNSLPHITADGFTYQRADSIIRYPEHIDNILSYNYVMYQNEAYTDKWFYAFITKMEYVNDHMTNITIKTDVYQTWQFDIIYKKCFIDREHVNDDTIGNNTIPENLETGEYKCNLHYKDTTMDSYATDLCFIMASTSEPVTGPASETVAPSSIYNGIYTGLTYYRYDVTTAIDTILDLFAVNGKTDSINGIFMCPKWLAPLKTGTTYREVNPSNSPLSFTINVTKQTTLDGYTPKNNKLKCYPFNYLLVSNNIGQNAILHYEKFSGTNATFTVKGVINPGCSINLTPTNYNGNVSADNDAIQLGKFPICNFQNDMYTNWLSQNSLNVLGQTITVDEMNIASAGLSSLAGTITNVAVGNYAGAGMSIASGFTGVASAIMQQKQHNMIPPTINGQLNSADINVASGNNTFHFYKMTIKNEYAKIIDDYFSAYGYKVNAFKVPNITGRLNWNYVKTIECNLEGDIPEADIQELKNIFNTGVTFWHNPSNYLDYTQANTIVT